MHNQLLRACRIAFMDTGGVATPDQIFAAILRLGSFQFHSLAEPPRTAMFRTLTVMSEMNEAKCLIGESHAPWQYTPGEPS